MSARRFNALFATVLTAANLAPAARGELLFTESFDYNGVELTGQNGGTGFVGTSWATLTGSTGLTLSSDDASLEYPSSITYTEAGERIAGAVGGNVRAFGTGRSLDFQNNSGKSYYMSVLVRKDAAGAFTIRTNNINNQPRWSFGVNALEQYIANLSGSIQTTTTGAAPVNQTILIVSRFVNNGGGIDQVELVAYAEGDTIPAAPPATWLLSAPGNTNVFQQQLELIIEAGSVQIDEIRIGTEWGDVVAVPEPAAAAVGAVGAGLLMLGRASRS